MSYGIIRIQKMKAPAVKGIQIHDKREKDYSHTNKDIDFKKSHLNYDLINHENISYSQRIKERIAELNLKRAVRKDAIVMCQCLITSDLNFFEKMKKSEQDKFFKDSLDFIKYRYGEKNIISATVHFDEKTPHMHINFVPVTFDGRLSAKDLFKKNDLIKLHDDFFKFNKSRGYDLKRGENKGEQQKHLKTEEYKLKTRMDKINEVKNRLDNYQDFIQSQLNDTRDILDGLGYFDTVEVKKSLIGGKIMLTEHDYIKLIALARQGTLLRDNQKEYEHLYKKFSELLIENEKLKEKSEFKILEELKYKKQTSSLKKKYNDLVDNFNSLLDNTKVYENFISKKSLNNEFDNYVQKLNYKNQIQNEKDNSWEIEL